MIVQVVLEEEFIQVLCVYVVHVIFGAVGAVASIRIFLFAHNDHAAPGETKVSVPLLEETSLIVHPSRARAVVF